LRQSRVPSVRIRRAVRALRNRLDGVTDPLKDLKIFCEGRRVAVLLDGQKMEPVSGQLLLDFDAEELRSLLAFPGDRQSATDRRQTAARKREAEEWFEKGLDLEQTGAPPEEIMSAYRRAIDLDPGSAGALVNLGTIYYHLRKWADAERCYNEALAVDSSYALAHFNLANLFDETGDRERAMLHYQSAIRVNPQYADAHYNLALLYQSHGEVLKAVRHWQAYLKLDGSSNWAAIARRELDKLRRAAVVPGARNDDAAV
jgi:tetratricopeptide (TPR) repeat protein